MDPSTPHVAFLVLSISIWALGIIVTLLVAYLVIRLAVSHALRSHTRWLESRGRLG